MRNSFQIWINAVCEQVRFRPDHRSIELELRDHYEDHVQDLLRLGRPRELAEERALEAMGNAQEVGRALDKVHKPWLGWLWEVSRVLVLALALLLAWKLWKDTYTVSLTKKTWDQLMWTSPPFGVSYAATDYLDLWLAPGEPEFYAGTYWDDPLPGETRLQVPLTVWAQTEDVFHEHLVSPDQHWNLEVTADGRPIPHGSYAGDGSTRNSGYWVYDGPGQYGWTRYRFRILLILEEPPRRAEVTIPRTGTVLTAEWEGAA